MPTSTLIAPRNCRAGFLLTQVDGQVTIEDLIDLSGLNVKVGFEPLEEFGGSLFQQLSTSDECLEHLPAFANVSSERITTGMLGYGLVEAIADLDLLARLYEEARDYERALETLEKLRERDATYAHLATRIERVRQAAAAARERFL